MDLLFEGDHAAVERDEACGDGHRLDRVKPHDRIGFMQGRLSPMVDGRIQAFPWSCWQAEFETASRCGFRLMEWTLDHERLHENPLLSSAGRAEIGALCQRHRLAIPSLTGDCFMQAPFWKSEGAERDKLQRNFLDVADACAAAGIRTIVVPLVDNGRLDDMRQEDLLVAFTQRMAGFLAERRLAVAFESDFTPAALARFIKRLDPELFGINYDIGNSAALGFNPAEEIEAYGPCIMSVHVKDRMLSGSTVPLGTGSAEFESTFNALARARYAGHYILQTARAPDGDDADVLCRYREMTAEWITSYGA
jgi:L-ribulose-5-phosphate 3-epimerase